MKSGHIEAVKHKEMLYFIANIIFYRKWQLLNTSTSDLVPGKTCSWYSIGPILVYYRCPYSYIAYFNNIPCSDSVPPADPVQCSVSSRRGQATTTDPRPTTTPSSTMPSSPSKHRFVTRFSSMTILGGLSTEGFLSVAGEIMAGRWIKIVE